MSRTEYHLSRPLEVVSHKYRSSFCNYLTMRRVLSCVVWCTYLTWKIHQFPANQSSISSTNKKRNRSKTLPCLKKMDTLWISLIDESSAFIQSASFYHKTRSCIRVFGLSKMSLEKKIIWFFFLCVALGKNNVYPYCCLMYSLILNFYWNTSRIIQLLERNSC